MSRKPRNRVWHQCNGILQYKECCLCDNMIIRKAKRGERGEWHSEHVHSLSCGGQDLYPNLIPICKDCNLSMKKGCKSTFHHMANKGFITYKKADEELERHKLILTNFDYRCTAIMKNGKRCINHKCGKNEKFCFNHVKMEIEFLLKK